MITPFLQQSQNSLSPRKISPLPSCCLNDKSLTGQDTALPSVMRYKHPTPNPLPLRVMPPAPVRDTPVAYGGKPAYSAGSPQAMRGL
jgi:hypothetical protein